MRTHEEEKETHQQEQEGEGEGRAVAIATHSAEDLENEATLDADETPGPSYSAFDMMMASSKAQKLNNSTVAPVKKQKQNHGRAHSIPSNAGHNPTPLPINAPPPFCPAYKKVTIPALPVPIIVDGFKHASPHLSHVYFLTHFHSGE